MPTVLNALNGAIVRVSAETSAQC